MSFDHVRRFAVLEPRGHDALVGALLCEPETSSSAAGVIFFNNAGYLGMCGHAAIGTIVSLAQLGRIGPGIHRLDTPVGTVTVALRTGNKATVENVPSYVHRNGVTLDIPGIGSVSGDIAWGGNWFFITDDTGLELTLARNSRTLPTSHCASRRRCQSAGYTGLDGEEIDHIEMTGPSSPRIGETSSFVRVPPTTARPAVPGPAPSWPVSRRRENSGRAPNGGSRKASPAAALARPIVRPTGIIARITGRAFVTAEARLIRQPEDPFADGLADVASSRPTQPITVGDFAGRRTRFGSGLAQ